MQVGRREDGVMLTAQQWLDVLVRTAVRMWAHWRTFACCCRPLFFAHCELIEVRLHFVLLWRVRVARQHGGVH